MRVGKFAMGMISLLFIVTFAPSVTCNKIDFLSLSRLSLVKMSHLKQWKLYHSFLYSAHLHVHIIFQNPFSSPCIHNPTNQRPLPHQRDLNLNPDPFFAIISHTRNPLEGEEEKAATSSEYLIANHSS